MIAWGNLCDTLQSKLLCTMRWNVNKMWIRGHRPNHRTSGMITLEIKTQRNRYDFNMMSEAHKRSHTTTPVENGTILSPERTTCYHHACFWYSGWICTLPGTSNRQWPLVRVCLNGTALSPAWYSSWASFLMRNSTDDLRLETVAFYCDRFVEVFLLFGCKCVIVKQVRPNRGLLCKGTICWHCLCVTLFLQSL